MNSNVRYPVISSLNDTKGRLYLSCENTNDIPLIIAASNHFEPNEIVCLTEIKDSPGGIFSYCELIVKMSGNGRSDGYWIGKIFTSLNVRQYKMQALNI